MREQTEKYRANFLWPAEEESVEQAGYEFANGNTEEYQKQWWEILKERIKNKSGAPEMLEALESFVHLYDAGARFDEATLRNVANGMRAAIAKAKGESESLVTSEDKSE